MNSVHFLIAVTCSLSLAACSSYRDFPMGDSVEQMTAAQTANPDGHQGDKEGFDANKAEIALKVYRLDVSKPAEVKKSLGVKN